jgi:hypothetical protein
MRRPERHGAGLGADVAALTPREEQRPLLGVIAGRLGDVGPEHVGLELVGLAVGDAADPGAGVHHLPDGVAVAAGIGCRHPDDERAGELLLLLLVEMLGDVVPGLVAHHERSLVVVLRPLEQRASDNDQRPIRIDYLKCVGRSPRVSISPWPI